MPGCQNARRGRAVAANLPALYAEAWTAPRQSMRRILSTALSERDRLMMVGITGILFAIPIGLMFRTMEMPVTPDGTPVPVPGAFETAFLVVGMVILSYFFTAGLIKLFGGAFGGTASYAECKTTAAWTQFVVGLANLAVMILVFVLPGALAAVLRLVFTVGALYVSSAYVAEAHGFSSTGKVVAVSVAIGFGLLFLLSSMIPPEMLQAMQ